MLTRSIVNVPIDAGAVHSTASHHLFTILAAESTAPRTKADNLSTDVRRHGCAPQRATTRRGRPKDLPDLANWP